MRDLTVFDGQGRRVSISRLAALERRFLAKGWDDETPFDDSCDGAERVDVGCTNGE
jgi:hypothetical protein